jgi:prepilin-type N-terminal cleavage/methylation domain-containing protein
LYASRGVRLDDRRILFSRYFRLVTGEVRVPLSSRTGRAAGTTSKGVPTQRRAPSGFTLIEVLLVLVIVGILATLAVVHIAYTKEHAYVAAMVSDLNNLEEAEEAYFVEFNTYTAAMPADRYMPTSNNTYSITTADFTGWSAIVTRENDLGAGINTCHIATGTDETTASEWPGAPYCP